MKVLEFWIAAVALYHLLSFYRCLNEGTLREYEVLKKFIIVAAVVSALVCQDEITALAFGAWGPVVHKALVSIELAVYALLLEFHFSLKN